jgi:hypothetical protein
MDNKELQNACVTVLLGLSTDHQSVPIQPEGYVPVDDALDAVAPSP